MEFCTKNTYKISFDIFLRLSHARNSILLTGRRTFAAKCGFYSCAESASCSMLLRFAEQTACKPIVQSKFVFMHFY